MMITTGNITGRTFTQEQDKWGRWVITQLQGRRQSKLAIVTVYQVVAKHGFSGATSTARQQQVLLAKADDGIKDPRLAFKRDLQKELQAYLNKGFELLVLGDFNEQFGDEPDGMDAMAQEIGLLHLMRSLHRQPLPATYVQGQSAKDVSIMR